MTEVVTVPSAVAAPRRATVAPADAVLFAAIALAGGVAALLVDPFFWFATPVVALALLAVSRRRTVAAPSDESTLNEFPAPLRRLLTGAFAQLPEGEARRLLTAVVRPARALFAARESDFSTRDDAALRTDVAELLEGACDLALDLARLDDAVPATGAADAEIAERFRSARALFAKHLADAALALSGLFASGVEHGTPASDRVAEVVTALREEATVRSAASQELRALLARDTR